MKPSEKHPRKAPQRETVTVRAKDGATVPVVLGGKRVVRLTGDMTATLPVSSFTRRRLKTGCLVEVKPVAVPKPKKVVKPDTSFRTPSAEKGDR